MMKLLALAALTTAAALAGAQPAPEAAAKPAGGPVKGASYVVDPTHTFVIYEIGHYGTSTNRGRFGIKDGSIRIDPSGSTGKVDITVDVRSVDTGVELLDRHLRSKEFFDVAEYPSARFVAGQIDFGGDKVTQVNGTLTLMGQTRPVLLRAIRFNCYLGPLISRQVCGGDFEATVERSQWGIRWGLAFGFEDKVRLLVQVEAVNVQ